MGMTAPKILVALFLLLGSLAPMSVDANDGISFIARAIPVVELIDAADENCWTNLNEVKDAAELSLRRAYKDVYFFKDDGFQAAISKGYEPYFLEIFLNATRSGKDGTGVCFGSLRITAFDTRMVDGLRLKTVYYENGLPFLHYKNLNEYTRTETQRMLDMMALEVLRYRSGQ